MLIYCSHKFGGKLENAKAAETKIKKLQLQTQAIHISVRYMRLGLCMILSVMRTVSECVWIY